MKNCLSQQGLVVLSTYDHFESNGASTAGGVLAVKVIHDLGALFLTAPVTAATDFQLAMKFTLPRGLSSASSLASRSLLAGWATRSLGGPNPSAHVPTPKTFFPAFWVVKLSLLASMFLGLWWGVDVSHATAAEVDHSFLTSEEQAWLGGHATELCVAPEANYPPFSFTEAGAWRGLSADMLRLMEAKLSAKFTLLPPQNLASILSRAQQGGAGIVTSARETPARSQFLAFTQPYVRIPMVIIVKADSRLGRWPEAFAGKQVAVGKGYGVQEFLAQKFPDLKLVLGTDDLEGLRRLAFGDVDAAIMDIASATFFIEREKITNLRFFGALDYQYDLSLAVRKELPVLRDILDKAYRAIPERDRQAVVSRWIHLETNSPAPPQKESQSLWPFLLRVLVAVFSIGATAWIVARRREVALRHQAGALGLLAAGLLITGIYVLFARADAEHEAQRVFEFTADEIRLNIEARLHACAQVLRSSAALFDASKSVERGEWRIFNQGLRLEQQLPGIQGVGFAQLIPQAQLAAHEQAIRREGFPEYKVRPAGDRETYSSIIYLEPFSDRNVRAFGYDMLTESVRRAAMERARDEYAVALSGKVTLVQETNQDLQAGTLLYFPVYGPGLPRETFAQRRSAIIGWVYSPYRMTDLIRGSLRGWEERLNDQRIYFEVYDGETLSADTLLCSSQAPGEKTPTAATSATQVTTVNFAGRRWTLRFTLAGGLPATADYSVTWAGGIGGTIISLLLYWLTLSLLGTRANARRIAVKLTNEIRQSEKRFAVMADAAPVLLWEAGTDNLCNYFNKTWLDFTGRTLEQEMGNGWADGVHPDDLARCLEIYVCSFAARREFEMEYRLRRHDGQYRWILDHGVPRFHADKTFAGYVGSCIDITERRETADRLHLQSVAMNAAASVIVITNPNGVIEWANQAFTTTTGYTVSEAIDLTPSVLKSGLQSKEFYQKLWATITAGEDWYGEFRNKRKDGTIYEEEARIASVKNNEGVITHFIALKSDITERKRMEAQLRASEESYRNQFALNAAVMLLIDPLNGAIVDANAVAVGFYGYPREQLLSMKITEINTLPAAEVRGPSGPSGRIRGARLEFQHRLADGSVRTVEVSSSPIQTGERMLIHSIIFDITESKRAEAALQASEARLKAILENSRDAIGVHLDGTWVLCNPAAVQLFGLSAASDLLGSQILNVIAPGERERIRNFVRQRTEEKDAPLAYITRGLRADGTEFDMEVALSKFPLEGKIHVFVILRDITERLRSEVKVRQLAREQQIILESANVGISLIRDRKQVWINDKTSVILRYPREELEGYSTQKFYPTQEAYDQLDREAYSALAKGAGYETVQRLVRGDGVQIWVRYIGKAIDPADMAKGVLWLLEDITERKQTEQELEENRRHLALAMDQALLAYWEMDAAKQIFTFNDRFYALYATTAEREGGYQMAAKIYAREFIPAEDQHVVPDDIDKLLSGEIDELQQEHRIRRRDGELRDIRVRITVVRGPDGRVVGTRGSNQDITESKRAQEALRSASSYARKLIEVNLDPLVTISSEGKITDLNEASVRAIGVSREQLIGTDFSDYFTEPARARDGYQKVFAEGLVRDYPLAIRHVSGRVTDVLYNASIYRDKQGQVLGVFASARDVTERLQHERKVQAMLVQTEHDAHTKSELLREVNHRVTNNLTSVLGLMVYEKNGLSGDDQVRIAPSLDRLQQRIRGLITVHRMLSQSNWAPVNVAQLAGEIILAALNAAPWRNQVVVSIEPSALRVSPRQANGVALIFNELATNSVKYAHLDSRPVMIRVELVATEGFVTICYRDNGPGFATDVLENKRSNIGLKLIRDMVATTLVGTIELENDDGAKTTIRLQPEKESRT